MIKFKNKRSMQKRLTKLRKKEKKVKKPEKNLSNKEWITNKKS